ncbi:MAG: hypothetical protein V3W44_08985 [Dehalococcoidales bacterium]
MEQVQAPPQQQQSTMDPTLLQLMQTLVAQSESVQRLNSTVSSLSSLLEECRMVIEGAGLPLPEGLKPSDAPAPPAPPVKKDATPEDGKKE